MSGNQQKATGSKALVKKSAKQAQKADDKPLKDCFRDFQDILDIGLLRLNTNMTSMMNETMTQHHQKIEAERNDIYIDEKTHMDVMETLCKGVGFLEFWWFQSGKLSMEDKFRIGYVAWLFRCILVANQVVLPPRVMEVFNGILRDTDQDAELKKWMAEQQKARVAAREAAARQGQGPAS